MKKIGLFLLLIGFNADLLKAQAVADTGSSRLADYQVTISALIRQSLEVSADEDKIAVNTKLQKAVESLLNYPQSAIAELDSLKKFRILQVSPDKELKIISWDLMLEDKTHRYFGYLLHLNVKNQQWDIFKLNDVSDELKNPENTKA